MGRIPSFQRFGPLATSSYPAIRQLLTRNIKPERLPVQVLLERSLRISRAQKDLLGEGYSFDIVRMLYFAGV